MHEYDRCLMESQLTYLQVDGAQMPEALERSEPTPDIQGMAVSLLRSAQQTTKGLKVDALVRARGQRVCTANVGIYSQCRNILLMLLHMRSVLSQ